MVDPTATAACDWSLIRRCAAGDRDARTAFWHRYAGDVRSWLSRHWALTPYRSCVDDALQDVFVECFRPDGALARVDPARAVHGFPAFLHGVVRHVALRVERDRAREHGHRRQFAVRAEGRDARDQPPELLERTVAREHVLAALACLDREDRERGTPRSLRTFLREHFEEGLPVRLIARAHAEPPELVHERRRRACRRLRECLRRVVAAAANRQPAT